MILFTSQQCSQCGHTSSENRKVQEKFSCVECGHSENEDINAAKIEFIDIFYWPAGFKTINFNQVEIVKFEIVDWLVNIKLSGEYICVIYNL